MLCRSSVVTAALVGISLLAHTGCPSDDGLDDIVPYIEVGDPLEEGGTICDEDRFSNCAYAFGEVSVGEGRTFKLQLENTGGANMTITSIAIDPARGDASRFTVEGVIATADNPLVLEPTTGPDAVAPLLVDVKYIPNVEGNDQTAYVLVTSDADNTESNDGVLEIKLVANAIDTGRPEVVIEPAQCDFGEVGLGAKAFCDISVRNVGARDLEIRGVAFLDDTTFPSVFNAETIVPIPSFVAPGTALSIRFSASPTSPQVQRNTFVLSSNDPLSPDVEVPLEVLGAEAPTAVARVLAINNIPTNQATPDVRPLDDVVVTGEDSVPAQSNGTIVAYTWELLSQPQQSSVTLSTPAGMTTGFRFNSAQGVVNGLDVAGEYVVRLTVEDDAGLVSTNDARVVLNAVPSEALHVELTWESPNWDLDLHMIRGADDFCSDTSCYYGNCKPGDPSYPEWDGFGGRGEGDPVLDIDDLDGYGPENINIDAPTDGTYRAAVHTYSSSLDEDVGVTVKVYVNGALAYDDYRIMSGGDELWEVVEISWSNGVPTVFPVNLYDTSGGNCSSY